MKTPAGMGHHGDAPRPRGRPPKCATAEEKRAAQAEAARKYRARKDPSQPLHSDVLDLVGELPPWRRECPFAERSNGYTLCVSMLFSAHDNQRHGAADSR